MAAVSFLTQDGSESIGLDSCVMSTMAVCDMEDVNFKWGSISVKAC